MFLAWITSLSVGMSSSAISTRSTVFPRVCRWVQEYPQISPKVEYSLTPLGWKMASVLKALREFTAEYKRYLLSSQVPPHSV